MSKPIELAVTVGRLGDTDLIALDFSQACSQVAMDASMARTVALALLDLAKRHEKPVLTFDQAMASETVALSPVHPSK